MREVMNMAKTMREQVAALKQQYSSTELQGEIDRANVNSEKMKSFTQELKEANLEVEAFLGETGSNFPNSETSSVKVSIGSITDVNGVTLNKEP